MAYAWYNGAQWLLVVAGLLAIAAYALATRVAWKCLPHDPVGSVRAFERRLFAVAAVTTVVSATGIILGIEFVVPDPEKGAPDAAYQEAIKTVAAAGLAAIVAFITAFGTKAEGFDTAVGDSVEAAFAKRYKAVDDAKLPERLDASTITLPRGKAGWEAAFGVFAFDGWGSAARRKRANQLMEYLEANDLNRPA